MTVNVLKELEVAVYEGYASQLSEMCNIKNIPVEFEPWEETNGGLWWSPRIKKLVLMGDMATENNLGTIVCWLHELGHVTQFEGYETNRAFIKEHGNAECEVNAWEIAFDLAFELGFTAEQLEYMLQLAFHFCRTYWEDFGGNRDRDRLAGYTGEQMTWVQAEQRIHKACEIAMSVTV